MPPTPSLFNPRTHNGWLYRDRACANAALRHNLDETLVNSTPLSWDVVRRFMSGDGGFGQMYRQVGFEPSAAVAKDGFLDLIGSGIWWPSCNSF